MNNIINNIFLFIKRFYSYLIISFLFFISHVLLRPYYLTNDDATFKLILSGKFLPDFPAISWNAIQGNLFTNFIYLLFKYFPKIPWYDLFLLFCTISSSLIICNLIKKRYESSERFFIMATVLLIILLLPVFSGYQFTIEAMMLAGSSSLWLIDLLFINKTKQATDSTFIHLVSPAPRGKQLKKKENTNRISYKTKINIYKLILIALFFIASLSLRFESALTGIILCFFIYAINNILGKQKENKIVTLGACLLGLLVFSFCLKLIDTAMNTPDEKVFTERNKLRLSVTEFAVLKRKDDYRKIDRAQMKSITGYSYNDYMMLRSWFSVNNKFVNEKSLKKLFEFQKERYPSYEKLYGFFDFIKAVWFYFAIIILVALVFGTAGYLEILLSIVFLICMFACMTYLTKEPPSRVYIPVFLLTTFMFMLFPSRKINKNKFITFFILFNIILFFIAVPSMAVSFITNEKHKKITKTLELISEREKPEYIISLANPHQIIFPVYWNENKNKFKIIFLGMYNQAPWFEDFLKRNNLYENFDLKLCSDRILIGILDIDLFYLKSFLKETYGVDVKFERQNKIDSEIKSVMKFYKCKII